MRVAERKPRGRDGSVSYIVVFGGTDLCGWSLGRNSGEMFLFDDDNSKHSWMGRSVAGRYSCSRAERSQTGYGGDAAGANDGEMSMSMSMSMEG